jgi:hypothetical protein
LIATRGDDARAGKRTGEKVSTILAGCSEVIG